MKKPATVVEDPSKVAAAAQRRADTLQREVETLRQNETALKASVRLCTEAMMAAQDESARLRLRLEACEYAMVLMQAQVRNMHEANRRRQVAQTTHSETAPTDQEGERLGFRFQNGVWRPARPDEVALAT
jgi:hypothetical protein